MSANYTRRGFIKKASMAAASLPFQSPQTGPKDVDLFAYYYPWYRDIDNEGDNNSEEEKGKWGDNEDYMPNYGRYFSNSNSLIQYQISQASEHLINGFAVNWFGRDNFSNNVTINNFLPTIKNFPDFKFFIFYDTNISFNFSPPENPMPDFNTDEEAFEKFERDFHYISDVYFNHPNYLRVDGKPVFEMYISRAIKKGFSRLVNQARNTLRVKTGEELYFIGDEVFWDMGFSNNFETFTEHLDLVDAVTAYNLAHRGVIAATGGEIRSFTNYSSLLYDAYAQMLDALEVYGFEGKKLIGKKLIPDLMFRYDDSLFRTPATRIDPNKFNKETPYDYDLFGDAVHVFKSLSPHFEAIEEDRAMALITSWNEWPERTSVEQSEPGRDRHGIKNPKLDYLLGIKSVKESYRKRYEVIF